MTAMLEKASAHELSVKFIGAVAQNGRLFALPRIIQNFAELVATKRGQISAEVVSAVALDEERQKLVARYCCQNCWQRQTFSFDACRPVIDWRSCCAYRFSYD